MMKQSILIFISAMLVAGCNLLNPTEELPVYVSIENPLVEIREQPPLYRSAGIKDAWVFLQNEQIGVFEMPAVIPILPNEVGTSLRIGGGVFETGLSGFRVEYPFWDDVNVSLEGVEPLDTLVVTPQFDYFPRDTALVYAYEAGFEGGSTNLESVTPTSNHTTIQTSTEDKFVGLQSGKVNFTATRYQFEGASPLLTLPQTGFNDIWCEISYRNDIPFTVLLVGLAPGSAIEVELPTNVVFSSPDEWNTAYIHLNDLARSIPAGAVFKLLIRASSLESGTSSGRNGFLFLDHIRLIHFPE